MIRKFSQEISLTAHTWHKLILNQYLNIIPYEKKNILDRIKFKEQNINLKNTEISEFKNSIHKSEIEINKYNLKLEMENEDIQEDTDINIDDEEINKYYLEIDQKELKLRNLLQSVESFNLESRNIQKTIKDFKDQLKINRQIKNNISQGETEIIIHQNSYKHGDEINYGYWKEGEMEDCLKNVKEHGNVDIVGKYIVGKVKFSLARSIYIERKFCIVPEKQISMSKVCWINIKMEKFIMLK